MDERALIQSRLERELADHGGEILPPWRRYPDHERFTSFWLMGEGELYGMLWNAWLEGRDTRARIELFRRYAPIPTPWADWVASAVYDDWEHDSDDETVAQVHRLERETGLVDAAAWEQWLGRGG